MEVRTLNDLNNTIPLRGHKELGEFNFDDYFIEAIKVINNEEFPEVNGMKFSKIPKFTLKPKAKTFFNKYYKLHDIRFLPSVLLGYIVNNNSIKDVQDLANLFNKACIDISPYNLPIQFNINNVNGGTLSSQVILTHLEDFNKELMPLLNVAYTDIRLSKTVTSITVASYIHEITHSQVDHYKRVIEEFYNSEVLSIFNELLYSYDLKNKNVFFYQLANRLNHLFNCFNSMYLYKFEGKTEGVLEKGTYTEFDYHTDAKYLLSILKAINMFALCLDDEDFKEYLISQIQTIFDGKRTVEEMLYDIDVNNETSLNPEHIRKLVHLQ